MRCPTCFEGTLETMKGDYIEGKYTIKDTEWEQCPNCGEKLFGPKIMEELARAFYVNNDLIFPEDIKQRRENCGKTQQELADALGVSPNSIKRWEKGSYIQPGDKNKRIEAILSTWENDKLENLTVRSWVNSIRMPDYVPSPAFATHTIDNKADNVKKTKKLLEKLKK
ncbi:MAG: helix-turn-helix domain-containing protein [Candidatus Marinimicrobia bacterium]|nr:helix-turn-helix domain-containing protein [Candidatus Neomarinimicrobiota bacterium]